MPTRVSISNQAIGFAGGKSLIQTLDERSAEAKHCRNNYEPALKATLAAHDWNFARVIRTGAQMPSLTPAPGYSYVFGFPQDAVRMRAIGRDFPAEPLTYLGFQVTAHPTGGSRIVHTRKAPATLIFTAYASEPTFYDDQFCAAFAYYLAHLIAGPLCKDLKRSAQCLAWFNNAIDAAAAADLNEGVTQTFGADDDTPDWIAARG